MRNFTSEDDMEQVDYVNMLRVLNKDTDSPLIELGAICAILSIDKERFIENFGKKMRSQIRYRLVGNEMEEYLGFTEIDEISNRILEIASLGLTEEKEAEDLKTCVGLLNHLLMELPAFIRYRHNQAIIVYKRSGKRDFLDFVEKNYAEKMNFYHIPFYEDEKDGKNDRQG